LSRIAFIDAKCRKRGSKAGFTDGLLETNWKRRGRRTEVDKIRTGNGGGDLRRSVGDNARNHIESRSHRSGGRVARFGVSS
jgi:hypothetical protein